MSAGNAARCRGCNALIVWRVNPSGRRQPFNPDNSPHHATCPKAETFKRLARRRKLSTGNSQLELPTPITTRCAACGEIKFWAAGELVDDDAAPHRLTCARMRRPTTQLHLHRHTCPHCAATSCQVTSDSRAELHRCAACMSWRLVTPTRRTAS